MAKEHQNAPNILGPTSLPKMVEENVGAITSNPPKQQLKINTTIRYTACVYTVNLNVPKQTILRNSMILVTFL